jgi:LuxR family maltose regulon positive regulatory protein
MLAQSKTDEAIAKLTRSLAAAEASGRLGSAIELRILRSLALVRRGDIQGAEADLERALALAEPEGYMRIFLDEGESMLKLLKRLKTSKLIPQLKDYVNRLLKAFTRT